MLRRVGADPELLLEMVETFTQESARLLGEIRGSIVQGDAVHLAHAAHSLKGALRTLAARPSLAIQGQGAATMYRIPGAFSAATTTPAPVVPGVQPTRGPPPRR